MKTRIIVCQIAMLFLATATAQADKVYLHSSKSSRKEDITKVSPLELSTENGGTLNANDIRYIEFDGEPKALTSARRKIQRGGLSEAKQLLKSVNSKDITRDVIKQDLEFYQAYCSAQISLSRGSYSKEAVSTTRNFLKKNPKSFHYFAAKELYGDLMGLQGGLTKKPQNRDKAYKLAAKYYGDVEAAAPWPEVKLRMNVKQARLLQKQGKNAEAVAIYNRVAQSSTPGEAAEAYRLEAKLGKANALVASGSAGDGIQLVEDVIRAANPKEKELMAQAYLALAKCHGQAGQAVQERMAYLHIDVLYFQNPEIHAEALFNLVKLWKSQDRPLQAAAAARNLSDHYPNSSWAKKR